MSFVALTIFAGFVSGLIIDRTVSRATQEAFENRLGYEATMLGQMTANALFGDLDPNDTSLSSPVHSLGEVVHTRLAVVAKDGTVVADSETDDAHTLPSQSGAPEIASARTTGTGVAARDGRLFVAHAIVRDSATLGFATASVPIEELTASVREVRKRIVLGTCIATLAAILLGLLVSSRLVKPIRSLSAGARRVGAGDFAHDIAVGGNDEISDLAGSFNDMTASLRDTISVLDRRNKDMRVVLDNVGQGLLTLDRDGNISKERSAVANEWLGDLPERAKFSHVLEQFDAEFAANFDCSWDELVEGAMPMRLLVDQLPKQFAQQNRSVELNYTPIRESDDKTFDKLLVVMSDITARLAAEQAEAEQREIASVFGRIAKDKAGVMEFMADADAQVELLTRDSSRPDIATVKRSIHTLKGNAGIFGFAQLSTLCHEIESRLEAEEASDLPASDRDTLVIAWEKTKSRVAPFLGEGKRGVTLDDEEYNSLSVAIATGVPRAEIAKMVRSLRMDRAKERLERLAESAKKVGERLAKPLQVEVNGGAVRLPGDAWGPFWSSLTHVIRNAIDHGLEDESERVSASKQAEGVLRFGADQTSTSIVITIEDDGRGVSWDRVAAKARKAGLPADTPDDLTNALFADGVSSKDDVTELSGRGVGLSAVKAACEQLGGRVGVTSKAGVGTTFRFEIPLPKPSLRAPPQDSLPPTKIAC